MKTKYALFYDFHTSTVIPDVGKNFDVEKFTDNLRECGIDFHDMAGTLQSAMLL